MTQQIDLEVWKNFTQNPRLGEILLQHKRITINQLVVAMDAQKEQNVPIGEVFINLGFITKNELIEVLELQNNIGKILTNSYSELKKLKDNDETSTG